MRRFNPQPVPVDNLYIHMFSILNGFEFVNFVILNYLTAGICDKINFNCYSYSLVRTRTYMAVTVAYVDVKIWIINALLLGRLSLFPVFLRISSGLLILGSYELNYSTPFN